MSTGFLETGGIAGSGDGAIRSSVWVEECEGLRPSLILALEIAFI